MVITPKPRCNNELLSMLSLLEFITPLDAALLTEQNQICFLSQRLRGTHFERGASHTASLAAPLSAVTQIHSYRRLPDLLLMRLIGIFPDSYHHIYVPCMDEEMLQVFIRFGIFIFVIFFSSNSFKKYIILT